MPKVSVTIVSGGNKRTYAADYAYVGLLNGDGVGSRWEQEPIGWKDGLGLFFSGMHALKAVAEQEGKEGFKEAARAAMNAMSLFDPDLTEEDKQEKVKDLKDLLEKRGVEKERKKRSSKGDSDAGK